MYVEHQISTLECVRICGICENIIYKNDCPPIFKHVVECMVAARGHTGFFYDWIEYNYTTDIFRKDWSLNFSFFTVKWPKSKKQE